MLRGQQAETGRGEFRGVTVGARAWRGRIGNWMVGGLVGRGRERRSRSRTGGGSLAGGGGLDGCRRAWMRARPGLRCAALRCTVLHCAARYCADGGGRGRGRGRLGLGVGVGVGMAGRAHTHRADWQTGTRLARGTQIGVAVAVAAGRVCVCGLYVVCSRAGAAESLDGHVCWVSPWRDWQHASRKQRALARPWREIECEHECWPCGSLGSDVIQGRRVACRPSPSPWASRCLPM